MTMLARSLLVSATTPSLSPGRLRHWLRHHAISAEGEVWSWTSPHHPGFAYPEAAGLWLAAMADIAPTEADAVLARLGPRVRAADVGRDGRTYAFDLAVALAGLLHAREAARPVEPAWIESGRAALASAVQNRRACAPEAPPRWSTRWGPHLLKIAFALDALQLTDALARVLDDALQACDGGRFVTDGDGSTYVHAHCYAAEGLWFVASRGDAPLATRARSTLRPAVDWLADIQASDGSLPASWDGAPSGPGRTDATAQAIRLWAVMDPTRFAAAIERGLRFLSRHAGPDGGLAYDTTCDDQTTWSAVFALQALQIVTATPVSAQVLW